MTVQNHKPGNNNKVSSYDNRRYLFYRTKYSNISIRMNMIKTKSFPFLLRIYPYLSIWMYVLQNYRPESS